MSFTVKPETWPLNSKVIEVVFGYPTDVATHETLYCHLACKVVALVIRLAGLKGWVNAALVYQPRKLCPDLVRVCMAPIAVPFATSLGGIVPPP